MMDILKALGKKEESFELYKSSHFKKETLTFLHMVEVSGAMNNTQRYCINVVVIIIIVVVVVFVIVLC